MHRSRGQATRSYARERWLVELRELSGAKHQVSEHTAEARLVTRAHGAILRNGMERDMRGWRWEREEAEVLEVGEGRSSRGSGYFAVPSEHREEFGEAIRNPVAERQDSRRLG